MTDNEELILQCQKKDKKAFDTLYKLYSPMIYGICRRYTGNKAEADDLLQECFIKIFVKIRDYKFQGSFQGWLRRLTVTTAINFLRVKKDILLDDINAGGDLYDKAVLPDAITNLNAQELTALVNKLPTGCRTVFNLYVVEGFKHAEIAKMLSINEVSSRTHLKKARTLLVDLMKNYYNDKC